MPATPVTVVSGFLGAGKTTLMNRILASLSGARVAALINDFGAFNIDADLIVGVDGDGVIRLENGCICCSIQSDLVDALLRVTTRRDVDYVVVEASGVSDPLTIVQTLRLPDLRAVLSIDGVVTVVDAEGFPHLDGASLALAERQVAVADAVIVNKTDLVGASDLARLRERLAGFHPRLFDSVRGDLPIELLVGLGRRSVDRLLETTGPSHDRQFDSWQWESRRPLSGKAVRRALRALPPGTLRAKGILDLEENPEQRTVLQIVGSRVDWTLGAPWNGAERHSRFVAIGMPSTFDRDRWTTRFEDAVGVNSGQPINNPE